MDGLQRERREMSAVDPYEGAAAPNAVLKTYHIERGGLFWRLLKIALIIALALGLIVYGFYYAITTPWLLVQLMLPLAALASVVVWALPEMKHIPTRTMERFFFAYFICLFVWPNYLAIDLPGLPWITPIRLTGFPLVGALMVSLSVSPRFRKELLETLNASPILWRGIVIFAIIMTLSVGLSRHPMQSVQKLIVGQINWIAIFFASAYIFRKAGRATQWFNALFWILALNTIIAIAESRVQHVLWSGHIPSFLKVQDASGILLGNYRSATGEYRAKSIFTTPLGLGEFVALAIPFVMHLILEKSPKILKLGAFLLLPAAIFSVVVSGSRLGMVGVLSGIMLYTLFWAILHWRRHKGSIVGPTILAAYPAAAMAVVAASFFVTRLRRMVWGGGATQASNASRHAQIDMGIPKIIHNPVGHGIGEAASVLGFHGGGNTLTIDNYYLSVALEYGVVGFIIFYGTIIAAIIYALRGRFQNLEDSEISLLVPAAIALVNFVIVKAVFSQQDNHPLVFMLMGMVCALVWRQRNDLATQDARSQ
jgi:hypothetical protein